MGQTRVKIFSGSKADILTVNFHVRSLFPQKQTSMDRHSTSAKCQKQTSALLRARQLTRPPNCLVIRVWNHGAHILQNAMTKHVKKCQVTLTARSTVVSLGRACNSPS